MSIKDRIAAANERADEGLDDEEDEGLSDILSDLSDADEPEFGAETTEEQEPTPAWEEAEEEEEVVETPEEVVSEVDTTETPEEEVETPEETPARDTLASIGFDVSGMTEAQAVRHLGQEFRNLAAERISQRKVPPAPQINEPTPPPAPVVTKPKTDINAVLAELTSTVGAEPENDPAWRGYIASRQIAFDGQFYSAAPGMPSHLVSIADKLNKHREWELAVQAESYRMPEKMKKLAEAVAENISAEKGLSMDQVETHFAEKQRQKADEDFAVETVRRCSAWMFQHSKPTKPGEAPRILNHPIHGTPMLTKEGMAYYNELQNLAKQGVTDSRQQHYYAISALGKSLDATPPKPQTTVVDGKQSASSAAKTTSAKPGVTAPKSAADKRIDLLKSQRKSATRSANVVSSGQSEESVSKPTGRPPSLGAMLERAFQKNNIIKGGKPVEDDD
jgi:hypothetical protein